MVSQHLNYCTLLQYVSTSRPFSPPRGRSMHQPCRSLQLLVAENIIHAFSAHQQLLTQYFLTPPSCCKHVSGFFLTQPAGYLQQQRELINRAPHVTSSLHLQLFQTGHPVPRALHHDLNRSQLTNPILQKPTKSHESIAKATITRVACDYKHAKSARKHSINFVWAWLQADHQLNCSTRI